MIAWCEIMNETLTNKQIAFVVFQIVVGYGIVSLPKQVAEIGGTGGWIALVISTLIFILVTNMFLYLGYTHKNQTLYEYSVSLVGKYVSKIIVVVYIIYFTLFSSALIRISSETIKITVFEKTPPIIFIISFYLILYYTIIKRLRVFARLSEIYGIIFIIAILIIQFIMFTSGDYINLRPFIVAADIPAYLAGVPKILFSFYGVEIIAIIPLCAKNNKNVFKYSSIMVGFIGFLYIIIVESCISLMGADNIIHYQDPLFVAIRRLDIPYLEFLRRPDGIFIMAWLMSLICTTIGTAYGAVVLLSKLFNKISFNLITAAYILMSFFICVAPKTFSQVEDLIRFINNFGVIPVIIIPIILLIVTKIKKKHKKMP
jgi:spore germination protein